ncbi:hypothetical protein QL285_037074 [Trifolium repens]|nr:hypothetical protein QL285_037074 [Trifolium repens]
MQFHAVLHPSRPITIRRIRSKVIIFRLASTRVIASGVSLLFRTIVALASSPVFHGDFDAVWRFRWRFVAPVTVLAAFRCSGDNFSGFSCLRRGCLWGWRWQSWLSHGIFFFLFFG